MNKYAHTNFKYLFTATSIFLLTFNTTAVWLTDSGIKVSKVRSNRPWHKPKNLFLKYHLYIIN
ncbi:hypothetical protein E5C28_05205 [Wolbachia endosymbiont of Drosophila mauritiana]|nr:hypothetical protein E5C28_05205 [Wolbachia endosymbiont of Drosophila mauritiana]